MGIEELNHHLQALFNPEAKGKAQLARASFGKSRYWRVGDRVTHLKNDTQVKKVATTPGVYTDVGPKRWLFKLRVANAAPVAAI